MIKYELFCLISWAEIKISKKKLIKYEHFCLISWAELSTGSTSQQGGVNRANFFTILTMNCEAKIDILLNSSLYLHTAIEKLIYFFNTLHAWNWTHYNIIVLSSKLVSEDINLINFICDIIKYGGQAWYFVLTSMV